MPDLDPRFRIIDEMMGLYMQNVSEKRVHGYLRHLKDIETDVLRGACAGCVEHGSQRGAPTVAEIRRRVGELGARRRQEEGPADVIPLHPECKRTVHETRYGRLLCCREEGHIGSCEAWFHAGGPRPEDAEAIWKLTSRRGNVVRLEDYEEPVL